MKIFTVLVGLATLLLSSCCTKEASEVDLVNDTFPEEQAEVRLVLDEIYKDAMTVNIDGLESSHLNSPKFTKFGPRKFERQSVGQTNQSETDFFSSVTDLNIELKDVKIDIFGDIAILHSTLLIHLLKMVIKLKV